MAQGIATRRRGILANTDRTLFTGTSPLEACGISCEAYPWAIIADLKNRLRAAIEEGATQAGVAEW